MFKKSVVAVIFSIIMVLSVSTGAFAQNFPVVEEVPYYEVEEGMSDEIQAAIADVNKVNAKIEAEIEKSQEKAEKLFDRYTKELAKEKDTKKQEQLKAKYEEQISKLIYTLQVKAEDITKKGIDKAQAAGITADIVLVDVLFGDRNAKIDPIVVVSW